MQLQIIGHLTNNIWYDSVSNSSMVRSGSLALIPEKKSSSSAVPNACSSDRDPYLVAWPNGCWLWVMSVNQIDHRLIPFSSFLQQNTCLKCFFQPTRWSSLDFNKGATPSFLPSFLPFLLRLLLLLPARGHCGHQMQAPDAAEHAWTRTQTYAKIECQNICQTKCQIEWKIECQIDCQNICQIRYHIEWQIGCQNICQIKCQIECHNMSEYMTDRMSVSGDHSKKYVFAWCDYVPLSIRWVLETARSIARSLSYQHGFNFKS